MRDLDHAIELNPDDAATIRARARHFAEIKQYKKSVADWSRVSELQPLSAIDRLALAEAQFLAGDRQASARSLASVPRINPARTALAFRAIRAYGKRLRDDDPRDALRVDEWYGAGASGVVLVARGRSACHNHSRPGWRRQRSGRGKRADLLERIADRAARSSK